MDGWKDIFIQATTYLFNYLLNIPLGNGTVTLSLQLPSLHGTWMVV